ncbi:hypothetical protein [Microseira wollei]|nr:hypothetical protein [Microseira wollei]
MLQYKLIPPAGRYVQVSICLNRVHLDGLTPDAAIAKLIEMGYTPEIRYQLNPQRQEFDLYAVIHEKHITESEMTVEACQRLWSVFSNNSLLYVIGCEADRDRDWIALWDLEKEISPPVKPVAV